MFILKKIISAKKRQIGLTLIELIIFIIVVSIGLTGILLVYSNSVKSSSDPLLRKQALAIAESLLEEIQLMPFTYCDPNDPSAVSATSTAGCSIVENMGPETHSGVQETRYQTTFPFDNVNDYNGFSMGPGIVDLTKTAVAGLGGYSASVTVTQTALNGIPATESLRILVTVTGPGSTSVTVEGYRTRYAPNSVP
jgi:MSHA pilin protein MshD